MSKEVLGYYISRDFAINSAGEQSEDHISILDYLLLHRDTINCFYHLSYNVACVLWRLQLSIEQLLHLRSVGELKLEPDYTIYYLSDKYFALKKGNYWNAPYVQFCDIGQYIAWELQPEQTLDYAKQKADEAKVIGQMVIDTLQNVVGLKDIDAVTSPVRVFEKKYLNSLDLPTVDDLPPNAGKYAYQAAHGGWFDVYQKGYFKNTWDYDIVAAYSYYTAQLMDTRLGDWQQTTEYQPDAVYGSLDGEITINKDFSPVIYNPSHAGRDVESQNYTPTGTWECSISKQMYEFLYFSGVGTFKIQDGYWWTPEKIEFPMRDMMERLFRMRERSVGLSRDVIKRTMVGIWGKLLEIQGDAFGAHFNPVWGEYVETSVKLQVAKACIKNGVVPLSIAVDGVVVDKPLQGIEIGKAMGMWKLSHQGKALIIGTDAVAIEGKDRPTDFSLDFNWIMDQIRQYPEDERYTMNKLSPVTLGKAFQSDTVEQLGLIKLAERSVEIGIDRKRCYPIRPRCGDDLLSNTYQGIAWDIGIIR
jgi:hypothetical protein